jgi:hypothetical protein
MLGMRRPWNTTKATKFFAKRWSHYKRQFKDLELQLTRTTNLLIKAQDSVLRIDDMLGSSAEIAAVNFPTEIKVRDKIVTDHLDLVVINELSKKQKVVELYFFDESLHMETGNDFGMLMRATTGVSSAKKDLIGYSMPVKCYLLNVFTLEKREIKLTKEHRVHYPRLLSNIVSGVEANAIYPRSSHESCKQCLYRNICTWKLK